LVSCAASVARDYKTDQYAAVQELPA
jgi:hypothetical protein